MKPTDILKESHEQWLVHPVTIEMFRVMTKHEGDLIGSAVDNSEHTDVSENFFRNKMVAVRTVRALKALVMSTDKFVEKAASKQ